MVVYFKNIKKATDQKDRESAAMQGVRAKKSGILDKLRSKFL